MIPLPTEAPQILFEDTDLLILFKPSHMYVHPPEDRIARKAVGRHTCIHWLLDEHKILANPIHRLDFSTEGILIFGKNNKTNSVLNIQMREGKIQKYYSAVVRGWFKEPFGEIHLPLESDSSNDIQDCKTLYSTIEKIELPFAVNSKFQTARYSLLDIELKTGRWHQIRRHMNRVAHPVLGDRTHGDSHHNRFFRDKLGIERLCLKAKRLEFYHPHTDQKMIFHAPVSDLWKKINTLFSEPI
jgi:tRNA pseudouridine65 synthase